MLVRVRRPEQLQIQPDTRTCVGQEQQNYILILDTGTLSRLRLLRLHRSVVELLIPALRGGEHTDP